jgi:CBS domain-containing protein
MIDRYSLEEDRRRYEDEKRFGPNRRDYEERGYEYGPGYEIETQRPRHESGRGDGRGLLDRASDEVRSWFGDDEAERRRHRDERLNERLGRESRYGRSSEQVDDLRARDLMTRNVTTVNRWDTVERAARLMGECDCGSLPVVGDGERLIGMITDRDIAIRIAGRGLDPRRAHVDQAMSDDVIACHENDSVDGCMRQMSRHQIRRLPIVDDRGRVVGIVSQGDLARHAGSHRDMGERRAVADVLYAVSEPTSSPRR